jgi:Ice-binding-like
MKSIAKLKLGGALLRALPLLPAILLGGPAASAATTLAPALVPPSFTTPVRLRSAGYFVILTKTGITDVPTSSVVGNIGASPITGAADHLTCTEVTGKVYSVDAAGPAPCSIAAPSALTTAVSDMQAAYTDAAGRTATVNELGGGNIGGLTLGPAVYKWSTGVSILSNVTLKGGPNGVWIFQIAKNLLVAGGQAVRLRGGAVSKHVFWQVAGRANLESTSHFEGILLSKTMVALKTGASVKGRLYAQTAVTLQMNRIVR